MPPLWTRPSGAAGRRLTWLWARYHRARGTRGEGCGSAVMEVPPPGEAGGVGKDSRRGGTAGTGQSQRKGAPGELWAVGAVLGYTASNLTGRAGVITGNPLAA